MLTPYFSDASNIFVYVFVGGQYVVDMSMIALYGEKDLLRIVKRKKDISERLRREQAPALQ